MGREEEMEEEEGRYLPSTGSFSQWLHLPGLGQTEVSSLDHLCLPHGSRGSSACAVCFLLLSQALYQEVGVEVEQLGLE